LVKRLNGICYKLQDGRWERRRKDHEAEEKDVIGFEKRLSGWLIEGFGEERKNTKDGGKKIKRGKVVRGKCGGI